MLLCQRSYRLLFVSLELVSLPLQLLSVSCVQVSELTLVVPLQRRYLALVFFLHFCELSFIIRLHLSAFLLKYHSFILETFSCLLQVGLQLSDFGLVLPFHMVFISLSFPLQFLDDLLVLRLQLIQFLFFLLSKFIVLGLHLASMLELESLDFF